MTSDSLEIPTAPAGEDWHRPDWSYILIIAIRGLRGWIFPLVILFFGQGMDDALETYLLPGIALAVLGGHLVIATIDWRNYRYRLGEREIVLKHGIISRQERSIPYARIQSVDLSQAPLESMFGVTRVQVQTGAGASQGAELELRAIRNAQADTLRDAILRRRGKQPTPAGSTDPEDAAASTTPAASSNGELLRKLSTRELVLAGATSGRIGAAFAIIWAVVQFGSEILPRAMWDRLPFDTVRDMSQNLQAIAFVALVVAVAAWGLSIVLTAVTYGGFELRTNADHLHLEYGLLDHKRLTVPVGRIQAIRIQESWLTQPLGLARVQYESAGSVQDQGEKGVLYPLIRTRDIPDLLARAVPQLAGGTATGALERLPSRARRRYIVGACSGWVILMLLVTAGAFVADLAWRWTLVGLLLTPVLAAIGNWRFADAGWALQDGVLVLRSRVIGRETFLARSRRLQHRSLLANPLQRRAQLTDLHVAVAAGAMGTSMAISNLDAGVGNHLMAALAPEITRPRAADAAGTGQTA